MAHIAYVTCGMTGALNAALAMAARLTAAGHQITFIGHSDVGPTVEAAGHRYLRLSADRDARTAVADRIDAVGMVRAAPMAWQQRRAVENSVELRSIVGAARVDALLIDIEMHIPVLMDWSDGPPVMLVQQWFSTYRDLDAPPLHTAHEYGTDLRSRLRYRAEWARLFGRGAIENATTWARPRTWKQLFVPPSYGSVDRATLRRVARANGVTLRDVTSTRHWLRPHLYPDIPTITTTMRELDFASAPPSLHYVGPMVHHGRAMPEMTAADLDRLDAFLDQRDHPTRRVAYCAMGTRFGHTRQVVTKFIEAARQVPDLGLVVSLGGDTAALDMVMHDDDVLILPMVPQDQVLAAADIALIHGGIGTINDCIDAQVPMLVLAWGAVDQPGCASRIEHFGLGRRMDPLHLETSHLAELIQRTLNDSSVAARLADTHVDADRYVHDRVLENLVEQLVADEL